MQTNCTTPDCIYFGKYCRLHRVEKVKVVKPIAPLSKKRAKLQVEYRKVVSDMLKSNPLCEIKSKDCTGKAEGLHHKIKRTTANLCEISNLIRACNACNLYVETHPKWATKKGFVKSKHETKAA